MYITIHIIYFTKIFQKKEAAHNYMANIHVFGIHMHLIPKSLFFLSHHTTLIILRVCGAPLESNIMQWNALMFEPEGTFSQIYA